MFVGLFVGSFVGWLVGAIVGNNAAIGVGVGSSKKSAAVGSSSVLKLEGAGVGWTISS